MSFVDHFFGIVGEYTPGSRSNVGGCWKAASESPSSWSDFDRRAIRDRAPDFVHLVIGHGNASVGPVAPSVLPPVPSQPMGESVNHNVAARTDACLACLRPIVLVWIG